MATHKFSETLQKFAAYTEGDRITIDRDLKQVGWSSTVKAGTKGVVETVDEGRMGTVAYKVRWDDGQTNWLLNGHLVARRA
jgi:thymidine phosphorylase